MTSDRKQRFHFYLIPKDTKIWKELAGVEIDPIDLNLPEFQQPLQIGISANVMKPKRKETAKKTTHKKRSRKDLRVENVKKSKRLQHLPPSPQKSSDESLKDSDVWTDEGSDSSRLSNVSSERNKNEVESEDESDTAEDRLAIDESSEVDPMQEAKMVREEMAELKAKMDEEGRRAEEESKKKLAEMKAQAAKRKAGRKAKQEELRRQMEAEKEVSSGDSNSTLVNTLENNENPGNTPLNDKTVTIEPQNAVTNEIIADVDGHTTRDIEDNFRYFSGGGLNRCSSISED